jgi:hypothetical protein
LWRRVDAWLIWPWRHGLRPEIDLRNPQRASRLELTQPNPGARRHRRLRQQRTVDRIARLQVGQIGQGDGPPAQREFRTKQPVARLWRRRLACCHAGDQTNNRHAHGEAEPPRVTTHRGAS